MVTGVPIPKEVLASAGLNSVLRPEFLEQFYGPTRDSVVCIRGKGVYRQPLAPMLAYDGEQFWDDRGTIHRPTFEEVLNVDIGHGSGIVIGKQSVEDREEYLILTNNHVAVMDPFPNPADDGIEGIPPMFALERCSLSLVQNIDDHMDTDHVGLEVIATDSDHDAALVRTVGAPQLSVYRHAFGAPHDHLSTGTRVVTFGYPGGTERITGHGYLTSLESTDVQLTTFLNKHYLADIPIDPGQSGSPVFVPTIRAEGDEVLFDLNLIGLVYGKGSETDTVRMITPWSGFQQLVETRKSVPSKRPSLQAPVDHDTLERLLRTPRREGLDIGSRRLYFSREKGQYRCEEQILFVSTPLVGESLRWGFTADDDISTTQIAHVKDSTHSIVVLEDAPDLQEPADRLLRARLNYFALRDSIRRRNGRPANPEQSRLLQYDIRVVNEYGLKLHLAARALAANLYRKGIVSSRFLE